MAWSEHRRFIRVIVGGSQVKTGEDISISEGLDQLTTVAEFDLAAQPTDRPDDGTAVTIDYISEDDGTVWTLFNGTVSSTEVESEPWLFHVVCCDQLEKLRATNKGGDLELTGMTDGEAWKAIADYVGITYDDADIGDTGYELGAREPIFWHDDASTSAGSFIAELDDVFSMKTMTVGDGRVIRFPVDWTPDSGSSLYATYEKHVDATFAQHHRGRGDRNSIQNVWRVTGVSAQVSDACTATPWAFAVAGNARIGRRVRTAEQSFSSDLIQSEPLAEAIVRRLMRRYNRLPDHATITLENDPNLHAGDVVKLIDHQYGIETGSNKRYLVTSVQRSAFTLSAELDAGAAGDEGTVTHGVDKVCGDVHTDPDWTDPYTEPDPLYPPADDGTPIDYSALFDSTVPLFAFGGTPVIECDAPAAIDLCDSEALAAGIALEAGHDWQLSGILTLTLSDQAFTAGVTTDAGDFKMRIAAPDFYDSTVGSFWYELLTPAGNARLPGVAPTDTAIVWQLRWTEATGICSLYADIGDDRCYVDSVSNPGAAMASAETIVSVTGSPTRDSEFVDHNCGDGSGGGADPPPGLTWTEDTAIGGAWVLLDDAHFIGAAAGGVSPSPQGIAFIDPIISGDLPDFVAVGYFKLGTEHWNVGINVASDNGGFDLEFDFGGISYSPFGNPTFGERFLELSGFGSDDGTHTDQGIPSFVAGVRVDWTLTVNPTADTVTLELLQGASSWTLTHVDTDWYTEAGDSSASITAFIVAIGNTIIGESVASLQSVDFL